MLKLGLMTHNVLPVLGKIEVGEKTGLGVVIYVTSPASLQKEGAEVLAAELAALVLEKRITKISPCGNLLNQENQLGIHRGDRVAQVGT